ncbi:MAG: hypothetical protein COB93_08010 [Sneathiella sp.]|nr:MAG: hypothetical protein COB93_08010 [Sneathiella sp.]
MAEWLENNPEAGLPLLQEMNKNWPFFQTQLSNMDMVLAKTNIAIASRYAELVDDVNLRQMIFGRIKAERQSSIDSLLAISGQTQLLEANPLLERSIHNRFAYLDPLNHIQVELLKQSRHEQQQPDKLLRGVHIAINGIAAGLRNSG